jgi:serine/threonine-protein kinase
VGYALAALVLFPAAEQDTDALVAVPRLTGRAQAEAERELEALGLTVEGTTELPHPLEAAGTVTAQSPLPGQRLQAGAGVRLAISSGRPKLSVPDLVGLPYRDAAALAEALGFTVNRREERATGPADAVLRSEPAPGTTWELPTTLVLVVTAPPEPEPEVSEAGGAFDAGAAADWGGADPQTSPDPQSPRD